MITMSKNQKVYTILTRTYKYIPYYEYDRLVIYSHIITFTQISKTKILIYSYQCLLTAPHNNRYVWMSTSICEHQLRRKT